MKLIILIIAPEVRQMILGMKDNEKVSFKRKGSIRRWQQTLHLNHLQNIRRAMGKLASKLRKK